jgi:hypothetical protein
MNDVVEHSYRGVRCMSCRQPIPIPAILIELDSRLRGLRGGFVDEHAARVFSLRCRVCEREKPYRTSDIVEFEGEPRPRGSWSHLLHPGEGRSVRARAANG